MWKKLILKDAVGGWMLLTGCLMAGVILNEMRTKPLPLVYSSQEARLEQTVEKLGEGPSPSIQSEGDVSLEEMQKISAGRAALILDARPEIFYRIGHIPSALSLPRDDFENGYRVLASVLQQHREQVLVVYCSGNECQDSQMVGNALQRLGYPHVRIFRGGWSDWESQNLPEEKQ
jgi:3-mercaptopyruvate sulfurtransferase SseA